MKIMLKSIGLLITGLLVAVIIYPLLHELGHSIMAVLVGASVLELKLFPIPYVLCSTEGMDMVGQVVIGTGGIILPLIISQIKVRFNFWLWYTQLLLKGISVLALIISAISTILFMKGNPLPNDDTTQILQIWPNGIWIILLLSVGMSVIISVSIVKEKPLIKCTNFYIKDKANAR